MKRRNLLTIVGLASLLGIKSVKAQPTHKAVEWIECGGCGVVVATLGGRKPGCPDCDGVSTEGRIMLWPWAKRDG